MVHYVRDLMSGNLISVAEADGQPLLHGFWSESVMVREQDEREILMRWLRIDSEKQT